MSNKSKLNYIIIELVLIISYFNSLELTENNINEFTGIYYLSGLNGENSNKIFDLNSLI